MNHYSELMIYGGIVGAIGIVLAFLNVALAAKDFSNGKSSIVGIFLRHAIFGLMYVGGGASFIIGFILYIVKVCKS